MSSKAVTDGGDTDGGDTDGGDTDVRRRNLCT